MNRITCLMTLYRNNKVVRNDRSLTRQTTHRSTCTSGVSRNFQGVGGEGFITFQPPEMNANMSFCMKNSKYIGIIPIFCEDVFFRF